MLANLVTTERGTAGTFPMPLAWAMNLDAAFQGPCLFEVDDEEYERLLGESAQAAPVSPDKLTCLAEAEVPSLWFF